MYRLVSVCGSRSTLLLLRIELFHLRHSLFARASVRHFGVQVTLRRVLFDLMTASHASGLLPISGKLSKYADKLSVPTRSRYLAKLEVIGGVDPLELRGSVKAIKLIS